MGAPLFFRRELGALRPADDNANRLLSKLKLGALVMVEIRRPRNAKHHRKWWVLVQLIADNLEGHYPAERISDLIKVRIGHVTRIRTMSGVTELPKSISFASMDQTAFEDFYDRAIAYICSDLLPGLDRDDLTREVLALLDGPDAPATRTAS